MKPLICVCALTGGRGGGWFYTRTHDLEQRFLGDTILKSSCRDDRLHDSHYASYFQATVRSDGVRLQLLCICNLSLSLR